MNDPGKVGLDPERLAKIGPVLEKYIGENKLAGALALIARRGEIAYLECFGQMDRENEKEMRPDTIFRIYSMTKPITWRGNDDAL
jgi:CubicO group peptidase (beta-lactamase class C family)